MDREEIDTVYLSGTHGGFKSRETAIEGAEDGDDIIGDGLTLLERLSHQHSSFAEQIHSAIDGHGES